MERACSLITLTQSSELPCELLPIEIITNLRIEMKRLFCLSFVVLGMLCSCDKEDNSENKTKDELTIYDKNGSAIAYCNYSNEDETIIYLWNGKPVAFFSLENEDQIYGFNGKFLCWRESGIYYDNEGKRIGFEKNALNMVTSIEPIKGIKEILPVKSVIENIPTKPIHSLDWSATNLDSYLIKGRE